MVELPEEVVTAGLNSLERLGVVVWHGDTLEIPKFEEAQEARTSDVVRKREQRQADKDRLRAEALRNTQGVSHGVTRGHTESQPVTLQTSQTAQPSPDIPDKNNSKSADADPLPVGQLRELWNATAHPSLPRWQETGRKRMAWARQRLRERPLDTWREVVERINASAFCLGKNDRGWRASPDWLLRSDTAAKVLEGKYDNRPGATRGRATEADKDWSGPPPKLNPDGSVAI
jgi:hypothetical protein